MMETSQQAHRRGTEDGPSPDERHANTQPGSAPDRATVAQADGPATPPVLSSSRPALAPSRQSRIRRVAAANRARLGSTTWPAYGAAGVTAAYGLLKAYWVFGGTALWSIAPLDPEMIERARSGTAPRWFEIADAVSVALAVAGVVFALATVRPRRWLPIRLVRWSLLPLAAFMVLRALLSIPGDIYEIASGGTLTHTALWDLVLWSPLFLIWGLLWAATALTYACRVSGATRSPTDS
jgi:hypothetical protein